MILFIYESRAKMNNASESNAQKIIEMYQREGIKFVCFDWDLTALSTHTGDVIQTHPQDSQISRATWFFDKIDEKDLQSRELNKKYLDKNCFQSYLMRPINENDFANAALFKQVVLKCLENDIRVYIMSFGYRILIRYCVELIFGLDQDIFNDNNVFTPSNFGVDDYTSLNHKNEMLQKLPFSNRSQVKFYDDDNNNINNAISAGFLHSKLVISKDKTKACGLASIDQY